MDTQTRMFHFDHYQCLHEYRKIQVYMHCHISLAECLYTTRGPQDPVPIHHTERQTYHNILLLKPFGPCLQKSKVKLY